MIKHMLSQTHTRTNTQTHTQYNHQQLVSFVCAFLIVLQALTKIVVVRQHIVRSLATNQHAR